MTNGPLKLLPRVARPHKLDVIGAVLLITSTSSLMLALSWGGTRFRLESARRNSASSPAVVVLLAAFFVRLRRVAEPLIPLEVLFNKVVLAATLAASLSVGLFLGLAIYTPIMFETLRGLSASQSGIALLPLMLGTVAGTLTSGQVMARFRHYKRLPLAILPLAIVVTGMVMSGLATWPIWVLSLLLGLISMSLGTLLPVSTLSIQNAVAGHQLGTATATANLCRQLSGAVAVAIFGAVIIGSGASEGMRDVVSVDRSVLAASFRTLFGLVALGAVAALVTMIVMEERPLIGPDSGSSDQPMPILND